MSRIGGDYHEELICLMAAILRTSMTEGVPARSIRQCIDDAVEILRTVDRIPEEG